MATLFCPSVAHVSPVFCVVAHSSRPICQWLGTKKCAKQQATVSQGRSELGGAATPASNCQKKSVIPQVLLDPSRTKAQNCSRTFATWPLLMLALIRRSPQGHARSWDVSRRHLADKRGEGRPRELLEAARPESDSGAPRAADGDPLPQLRHQIQVPVPVHPLQEHVGFIHGRMKPRIFLLVLMFLPTLPCPPPHLSPRIGRHSKSLDTQRFACALCTGQLVLLTPSKPRAPTPFASFVKENYGTARQQLAGQSHGEVMRKLSADFASKTKLNQTWTANEFNLWNTSAPVLEQLLSSGFLCLYFFGMCSCEFSRC